MAIPTSLKIFSFIYECRLWLLAALAVIWILVAAILLLRRKQSFLIVLAALLFILQLMTIATTWGGWFYRMELRNRYAQVPNMANAIDIDRMPPAIRAEYAKHDYHPRLSDVKRMILWNILLFPLPCLIAVAAWTMHQKNKILDYSKPLATQSANPSAIAVQDKT
jgi:hypothetical protein